MIENFYTKLLKHPLLSLGIIFLITFFLASYIPKVEIDASSETLLLKDDKDLKFTREVNKIYGGSDYLVITYSPKKELLDKETLKDIKLLSDELKGVKNVASITSILNVPLLKDPSKSLADIVKYTPTLENDAVDKALVKNEFLTSALYKEHLVSSDFKTTAILVNLKTDAKYNELLQKRDELLSQDNQNELKKVELEFKRYRDKIREETHQQILDIREILKEHQVYGELFLGGINMITDDMITYVKSDILTYGSIVIALIIFITWFLLKRFRFVVISIAILIASVIAIVGFISLLGIELTVVSSNFISLQMIITMSLVVHLSVHYDEELEVHYNNLSHEDIIKRTVV
ncbi:MAG: RND family transporter, partial [Campylobacterales bacterium]|nr:RND family transporter [Campylobacterales bacterium]